MITEDELREMMLEEQADQLLSQHKAFKRQECLPQWASDRRFYRTHTVSGLDPFSELHHSKPPPIAHILLECLNLSVEDQIPLMYLINGYKRCEIMELLAWDETTWEVYTARLKRKQRNPFEGWFRVYLMEIRRPCQGRKIPSASILPL